MGVGEEVSQEVKEVGCIFWGVMEMGVGGEVGQEVKEFGCIFWG